MSSAPCNHAAEIHDVEPSSQSGCSQCEATGELWITLRVCLVCGQVGCCNDSPNTHARKHYEETGHAIIQSYEPGETWRWCFEHDAEVEQADIPMRR